MIITAQLRTIFLVFVLAGVGLLVGCGGSEVIADLGGSEVIGRLTRKDSQPVAGASVQALQISITEDSAGKPLYDTVVAASVVSDKDGKFTFEKLEQYEYTLYASYKNDSLVLVPKLFTPNSLLRVNLGDLIMKAPGAIRGTVTRDPGRESSEIFCSIAGTSFLATVNSENDSFVLSGLLPDISYTLRIFADGYQSQNIEQIPVYTGIVTDLEEPVHLKLDTSGIPVPPTGLKISYDSYDDTLSGTALLTWHKVPLSDVSRYIVYIFYGLVEEQQDTVTDTTTTITVYRDSTENLKTQVAFQVAALDDDNMVGLRGPLDTLEVVPPSWLDIAITLNKLDIEKEDSICITANYSSYLRSAVKCKWWLDHPDSVITEHTLQGKEGTDTLVWMPVAGKKQLYVTITGDNDSTWTDSLNAASFKPIARWESSDSLLEARSYAGSCAIDGKIYIFGGDIPRKYIGSTKPVGIKTVEMYDPENGKWTSRSPMNFERGEAAYTQVNSHIYVLGGKGRNIDHNTIERYDPSTDSWELLEDTLPLRLFGATACSHKGVIYISGGITNVNGYGKSMSVIYSFNPASGEIKTVGEMNTTRAYHQMIVHGDQIFIFGGIETDEIGGIKPPFDSFESFSLTEKFSSSTPVIKKLRYPCSRFGAAVSGDQLVVFGGLRYEDVQEQPLSTVGVYSLIDGSWSEGIEMPFSAAGVTAVSYDGRIYLAGGGDGSERVNPIKTTAIYCP